MSYEEVTALAGAIQSLFVATAILVGGVWALFRFRRLNESARAVAELASLREALEPAITLQIDVQVFPAIGEIRYRSMQVVVRLHNNGQVTEVVDWAASGVSSARVVDFKEAAPAFSNWRITRLVTDLPWKGADIRPGEESVLSFLVPAAESGIYCLEVFVALSPRSVEASSAAFSAAGTQVPSNALEASSVMFVLVPEI